MLRFRRMVAGEADSKWHDSAAILTYSLNVWSSRLVAREVRRVGRERSFINVSGLCWSVTTRAKATQAIGA